MNLCVNARDAMPEGGTLTLKLENHEFDESFARMTPGARPGRYVCLSVTDTGEGIAPEHLDKIFDPFFTTKELGKGTGLGLSTVLGIVQSHDGFIQVHSQPGRGTEFKVYLPASEAAEAQPANEANQPLPQGGGELVLVVDDEKSVRQVTRKLLERNGYRVIEAAEGAEGITQYVAHQKEVQVVLTDLAMPVMDGPAFIRVLRRLNPQVRIIAMTGYQSKSSLPADLGVPARPTCPNRSPGLCCCRHCSACSIRKPRRKFEPKPASLLDKPALFPKLSGMSLSSQALVIAGRTFRSRLIMGTGKFSSPEAMRDALAASGAEMVTVALRRADLSGKKDPFANILEFIDPKKYLLLPNTSGALNADEAVRLAKLAAAAGLPKWVKLEIHPDPRYLLPDPVETFKAAEILVKDGFTVLPYINADPVLAKRLQDVGVATVMPLGSPIGSNRGIQTRDQIRIIIEQATVPVVVDAGLGAPSHAAEAMEMGADAVLVNTAVAVSSDPNRMAVAFKMAVEAGRAAFEAGLGATQETASATSPLTAFLD